MNNGVPGRPVEIRTLAGLRGLAAMIVVVSHSANLGMVPAVLGSGFGQTGVMLFFVLSGFLMAYLYTAKEFNRSNVVKYCSARVGRVFPLYYFLVAVSVVVSVFVSGETFYPYLFDVKQTLLSLALLQAPYVFWTIPVEIHFYFVFLLFWFVYQRFGYIAGILLLLALSAVPLVVIRLLLNTMPVVITSYMFSFVFGVFIALFHVRFGRGHPIVQTASNYLGLPLLILLLLNLPALKDQYFPSNASSFMRVWGDPITWFLILAVMVCAINESRSLSVLRNKAAAFMGDVSFGIYLYHGPIIFYFAQMTDFAPLVKFALAVAVTLIVAALSFNLMEKPLANAVRQKGQEWA